MRLEESKGNLYYVRLKTNCGILYKLGFTNLQSVEERLGYGGSRDVQLIDKVFLFLKLDNAYQLEQELHELLHHKHAFERYSQIGVFPLCQNGQSELFTEDVLKMDSGYTVEQGAASALNIREKILDGKGGALLQDKVVNIFLSILFAPLTLLSYFMSGKTNSEKEEKLETITNEIRLKQILRKLQATRTDSFFEPKTIDSPDIEVETVADLNRRIDLETLGEHARLVERERLKKRDLDDV